jgi:hypothetical protein
MKFVRACWACVVLGVWPLLIATSASDTYGQDFYEQNFYLNAQLPWHKVVLDSKGRLLAWYHPEHNLGYDKFLRLDWDFIEHRVPIEIHTGLKVYLSSPAFDATTLQGTNWQHNPAGTYAHFVDLLVGWYPYSGDEEAIRVVREMLDYQLDHGSTPMSWKWPGVPFATSCNDDKEYGRCIQDMPPEFYGGIETDKVSELGLGYVLFYELSNERKYLDAGIRCADALAKYVRPGDATHTPWPFRVDAQRGEIIAGEEYGGMVVASVRLFDELIRLGEGNTSSFKNARHIAWKWIVENPMNRLSAAWGRWSGYYEDIPKDTENENDMSSMMTCYYILSQNDPSKVDPEWRAHVGNLIDRSRVLLGRGPFFGAWGIDEQLRRDGGITGGSAIDNFLRPNAGALLGTVYRGCCSRSGLVSRTALWAAINAMYFEGTGDGLAREDAFRSLNYATYFAGSDGKISCCGTVFEVQYFFCDGYADAGRAFMWALGAVPDFAPKGQDHLLRSSSVVQKVKYADSGIEYQTFDKAGTEVLRLTSKPVRVVAGESTLPLLGNLQNEGYTAEALSGGDWVLHVRHVRSNAVRIELQ